VLSLRVEWFLPFIYGLFMGLAAMFLHEAAHLLAALALGVRVRKVGLKWNKGIYTVRETGPPARNMMIAFAGPLINILLISLWHWSPMFGLANFCYALANLAPIEGSDGSRIVQCWMQLRKRGPHGLKIKFPDELRSAHPPEFPGSPIAIPRD
jgi:Zn-dependent protease